MQITNNNTTIQSLQILNNNNNNNNKKTTANQKQYKKQTADLKNKQKIKEQSIQATINTNNNQCNQHKRQIIQIVKVITKRNNRMF